MAAALATFTKLSYRYPRAPACALSELELTLGTGLTVLSGPSGGGKTSLLRCLNGLIPHFHGGAIWGSGTILGRDLITTSPARLAIDCGFVFQDPERQFVYSTVEREVAFGLENIAFPSHRMDERIEWSLAAAGASHLRTRRVAKLSGGEKQRVAVAAAVATRPRLLALDEPTSQLDAQGAGAVERLCLELSREHGVILAEHRPNPGRRFGRRLVIKDGRVSDGEASAQDELAASNGRASGASGWRLRGIAAGPSVPLLEGVVAEGGSGQVVALVGGNGSGKTTLLRCLAGLLAPTAGTVERPPGRVAYLPQDPAALLHRPTLLEEVELTLRASHEEGDSGAVITELGLAGHEGSYPRALSGGQRQRAAIACVIVGTPGLVLLDEPTRGMDADSRRRLVAACDRLAAGGAAVVIATHDEELVARVADRVFVVREGTVSPR